LGESADFFSDERYCPNKIVFDKLLHRFLEETRKDSISQWSQIEEICKEKLKKLYDENIPAEIFARFISEFCIIVKCGIEDVFLLAHLISKKSE